MAKTPFLIGISGRARSGKDTLAWMLVDALRPLGIDARRYGWADALKAVCRVEYGMRGKDAPLLQEIGVAYRDGHRATCGFICREPNLLDGYFRSIKHDKADANVWVTTLLDQITEDAPDIAIISDTRFTNELDAIRAANGRTIRILRDDRPETGRDNNHISETALDDAFFDYTICNNGTLSDLRDKSRDIVDWIMQL